MVTGVKKEEEKKPFEKDRILPGIGSDGKLQ